MPELTILASMPAAVLEAARSIGLDAEWLSAEAGLAPRVLADPDGRVPLAAHLRLWTALSEARVGLEIGARLGPAALGVVGYAMAHGATVGDALALLERHAAVIHPEVVPRLERRDGGRVALVRPPTPLFARLREPVIAQAATTKASLSLLAGRPVRPTAVALPISPSDDAARVERHLGCPVSFAAARLELELDDALLSVALPRADVRLFGLLARRVQGLQADLPAQASFAERARREISAMLAEGEPSLPAVARRMAVSERTLHRRLTEEGTGFADLLDGARRERALLLVQDSRLGTAEIAFLLGYAEPSLFLRAFRRWTGTSPQAWRNANATAASGVVA